MLIWRAQSRTVQRVDGAAWQTREHQLELDLRSRVAGRDARRGGPRWPAVTISGGPGPVAAGPRITEVAAQGERLGLEVGRAAGSRGALRERKLPPQAAEAFEPDPSRRGCGDGWPSSNPRSWHRVPNTQASVPELPRRAGCLAHLPLGRHGRAVRHAALHAERSCDERGRRPASRGGGLRVQPLPAAAVERA